VTRRDFALLSAAAAAAPALALPAEGLRGVNLVETSNAPFGGGTAAESFRRVASMGANTVALIPFLWQSDAASARIAMGDALPLARLRAGIVQARAAGLRPIIKPHVWVPGSWAGAIAPQDGWPIWFAHYGAHLIALARLAQDERIDELIVGTEIAGASRQPDWAPLIAQVRQTFTGRLTYIAHGAEEVERFAHWPLLDRVGASLYPPLAGDTAQRSHVMDATLARVAKVARGAGKPVLIGEIGLRSAHGAAVKPWESAEERYAAPDGALQAAVIGEWLDAAARAGIADLLIWRWFSDPRGGGAADTDFTIQNKPAELLVATSWR
jgi:hypothetical protein